MKTEKELNELREKVEELSNELRELSDEDLNQVAGGATPICKEYCKYIALLNQCLC